MSPLQSKKLPSWLSMDIFKLQGARPLTLLASVALALFALVGLAVGVLMTCACVLWGVIGGTWQPLLNSLLTEAFALSIVASTFRGAFLAHARDSGAAWFLLANGPLLLFELNLWLEVFLKMLGELPR